MWVALAVIGTLVVVLAAWRGPHAWYWWRIRSQLLAAGRAEGLEGRWGRDGARLIARDGKRTIEVRPDSGGRWREKGPLTWWVFLERLGDLPPNTPKFVVSATPHRQTSLPTVECEDTGFASTLTVLQLIPGSDDRTIGRALLASRDVRNLLVDLLAFPGERADIGVDFVLLIVRRRHAELADARIYIRQITALADASVAALHAAADARN